MIDKWYELDGIKTALVEGGDQSCLGDKSIEARLRWFKCVRWRVQLYLATSRTQRLEVADWRSGGEQTS